MAAPLRRALGALALVLAATVGAADLYRWTDADGRTVFGDAPPPGATDVQKLGVTSKPTDPALIENLEVQKTLREKQAAMEDTLRAQQAQRAAEERAAKQEACDAARARHAAVLNSRKFATTGADGKESWLSGADAAKMKDDLKAAADKACAGL